MKNKAPESRKDYIGLQNHSDTDVVFIKELQSQTEEVAARHSQGVMSKNQVPPVVHWDDTSRTIKS